MLDGMEHMVTCKEECSLELDGIDHKGMEHALAVSEGPHIAFLGVSEGPLIASLGVSEESEISVGAVSEESETSVGAVSEEILTSTVRVSEEIWSDLVSDVAVENEISVTDVFEENETFVAVDCEIFHLFHLEQVHHHTMVEVQCPWLLDAPISATL